MTASPQEEAAPGSLPAKQGPVESRKTQEQYSASVVIPAHMEEAALPRQLASLLNQDLAGHRLHVVVIVNGSTDATAEAARAFADRFRSAGHHLDVVELDFPSKAEALNVGDRVASTFPRIYLDADITLSKNAIHRTIDVLAASGTPLLAAPKALVADCTGVVSRHYGRLWSQLPYIREQVAGVGFYAVNEPGRRLFQQFPAQLGADDKFVRLHFAKEEAVVLEDASFCIYLPERLGELIRVRGRWTRFNFELARNRTDLARRDRPRWWSSMRYVARVPNQWPYIPLFLLVWFGGWVLALTEIAHGGERWSRANSSSIRAEAMVELGVVERQAGLEEGTGSLAEIRG
jgi:glycosyltransferase involved in cell wall biosynthesis